MEIYTRELGVRGRVAGQVLLTRDVLANRGQYLHAREALERMLSLGVVPVVNENDTVVVDELRLGDNDRLAAIVSHLVSAGMLVILTDTQGLFSDDPRLSDEAELLTAVRHTDEILDELHRSSRASGFGSGGVATKVSAARMAAWSGIPTVIAEAGRADAALVAVQGGDVGTWVEPHSSRLTARKLWIAFGLRTEGSLAVDAGAAAAIVRSGASLLPAGIASHAGSFEAGAAVEVTADGRIIAKGLTRIGSADVTTLRGTHTSVAGGAVIHRDDLVVFG
jgi:glutamate 5-kinase